MIHQKVNNKGMTLPELVLAILMLTAFMGVTVMVTEFTARFFQPLNEEAKEESVEEEKPKAKKAAKSSGGGRTMQFQDKDGKLPG